MTAPVSATATSAPGAGPNLGSALSGRGTKLEFVFFMEDVEALEARLQHAISGASLAVFLEGEGSRFFHEQFEDVFNEEGNPKVGFWAPLSDATINIREALGFGPEPINRRTDEMYDFFMRDYPVFFGEGYAQMDVPGDATGNLAHKIKVAQQGETYNPWGYGPTPPRPVMAVSEMDAQTLMELYQVFFIVEMEEASI